MGHVLFCRLPALHLDARSLSSTSPFLLCHSSIPRIPAALRLQTSHPAANFSIGALQIPRLGSFGPSLVTLFDSGKYPSTQVSKYPSNTTFGHRILELLLFGKTSISLDPFMCLPSGTRSYTLLLAVDLSIVCISANLASCTFSSQDQGSMAFPSCCHCSAACRLSPLT